MYGDLVCLSFLPLSATFYCITERYVNYFFKNNFARDALTFCLRPKIQIFVSYPRNVTLIVTSESRVALVEQESKYWRNRPNSSLACDYETDGSGFKSWDDHGGEFSWVKRGLSYRVDVIPQFFLGIIFSKCCYLVIIHLATMQSCVSAYTNSCVRTHSSMCPPA